MYTDRTIRSGTSGNLTDSPQRRLRHDPSFPAAYGGFSNVWGSQLMPFTTPTFESWPVSAAEIRPHYGRCSIKFRLPARRMILLTSSH